MTEQATVDKKLSTGDRKYLRFAIAAFALLGLVALGLFLYEPLKLRYAMYRVRETEGIGGVYGTVKYADRWLGICVDNAQRGNRPAVRMVVGCSGVLARHPETGQLVDVAYLVAIDQPEAVFEVLDSYPYSRYREVIWGLLYSAATVEYGLPCASMWDFPEAPEEFLRKVAKLKNGEARRVAVAAVEHLFRRAAAHESESRAGDAVAPVKEFEPNKKPRTAGRKQ